MDLLLWRHAEAEDLSPDGSDLARRLTPKGLRQAAAMAAWLNQHGPKDLRILASPAVRTRQTAQALDRGFEISPLIAPDAPTANLVSASGWPMGGDSAVLLVGHQPTLGRLAARLITGHEAPWSVKKGALWWLQHRKRGGYEETLLKLVLPAELA